MSDFIFHHPCDAMSNNPKRQEQPGMNQAYLEHGSERRFVVVAEHLVQLLHGVFGRNLGHLGSGSSSTKSAGPSLSCREICLLRSLPLPLLLSIPANVTHSVSFPLFLEIPSALPFLFRLRHLVLFSGRCSVLHVSHTTSSISSRPPSLLIPYFVYKRRPDPRELCLCETPPNRGLSRNLLPSTSPSLPPSRPQVSLPYARERSCM